MKRLVLSLMLLFLTFNLSYGLSFDVAKVDGGDDPASILVNEPFTIEFYANFIEGDSVRLSWSTPFRFYGTGNVTTLTAAGTFVPDASFDAYFDFGFNPSNNASTLESWDGDLTDNAGGLTGDQFNYTGIIMNPPWLPNSGTLHMFDIQFDGIVGDVSTSGTFCVDSGDFVDNSFDWLLDSLPNKPTFGPVCWNVIDTSGPPPNQAPVLYDIGNKEVDENSTLTFTVYSGDPDGTIPTLFTSTLPTGAEFVNNADTTGTFSWTPTFDQAGSYPVTFYATDDIDTVFEEIIITVNDINQAPVLYPIGNREVNENELLTFTVYSGDPDGTIPILSTSTLPDGAEFTNNSDTTGTFSWTPTFDQAGSYPITFYASDGIDTVYEEITITVLNTNRPPYIYTIGNKTVQQGELLTFTVYSGDPDGTIPALTVSTLPAGASFTNNADTTGTFNWTPSFDQEGVFPFTFYASDGIDTVFEEITITVLVTQLPPSLVVSVTELGFLGNICDDEVTQAELDSLSFDISNDGDGTLDWTVTANESWLGFAPMDGVDAGTVDVWIVWDSVPIPNIIEGDTAFLFDTLTVTAEGADNSPQFIEVMLTLVCEPGGYFFTVDPTSFNFSVTAGDSIMDSLVVGEMYDQEVEFSYTHNSSWLNLLILSEPPTTPFSIPFYIVTDGYPDTTLYDTIVVTSLADPSNTPIYVPVTLTIENEYMLAAEPMSFDFELDLGQMSAGESLNVYELSGGEIYFWTTHHSQWLIVDTVSTSAFTPSTVYVSVFADDTLLPDVTYFDTIFIMSYDAVNSPLEIPVSMTPRAGYMVGTNPTAFNFTLYQGEAATSSLNIFEIYGREIGFLHYNSSSWLAVDPLGDPPYSTPTSLPLGISTIGLDSGMYYDTITITPDVDSTVFPTVSIPVTLDVIYVGPETEDSVWVSTVPGRAGTDITVPVYFRNFETLAEINLPLAWDSDDLHLNAVTFDGTRVDSVDNKPVVIDNASRRVQIDVMPVFSEPIYAGRGLLAKLHFSVAPGADPAFISVYDTVIAPAGGLFFVDQGMNMIDPNFNSGGVIVGPDSAYLCGRVIDTAGNEIEGAFVEIWNDFPNGYWVLGDTTDNAGQFACHSVGISPFDVYAYKEGYYPGLVTDVQLGEMGIVVVLTPVSPVTPTNEWVGFYCMDNFYSGVPLPVGSVVDAYDPDGVHCGTFFVTEAGKYGIMPVYRDDIFTTVDDGAEPGDNISFFINGYPATADGETIWTAMGDNFEVCLDVFTVEDRTIHLSEGWNLISWNIDTPDDDIMQVLSPISSCVELVLSFEQGGFTYDPELPEFSTLWKVDHLHGYWVRMTCDADLDITGVPVAATTPIQVEAGWNLVSYLPQVVDTIPDALASIHDQLVVALGFVNGVGLTYDPNLPGYSNLNYMGPGYGYWVNIENGGTLIYPGSGPSVLFKQTPAFAAKAIPGTEVNISRQWMNLYSHQLTFDGQTVPVGAEIKALDADGRVIGAAEVGANGKFGFMPVYADDPLTEVKEGVAIGDEFVLVVDGVESAESFTWTANGDRLEVGALTARTGVDLMPKEFRLAQNYPNPFNPSTTISFSLPTAMNATVEVFNILGERVNTIFNGMGDAGENTVIWHGDNENGQPAASGIYFYRLQAGDFQQSRKMILMK